jgi:hypothetical protein
MPSVLDELALELARTPGPGEAEQRTVLPPGQVPETFLVRRIVLRRTVSADWAEAVSRCLGAVHAGRVGTMPGDQILFDGGEAVRRPDGREDLLYHFLVREGLGWNHLEFGPGDYREWRDAAGRTVFPLVDFADLP